MGLRKTGTWLEGRHGSGPIERCPACWGRQTSYPCCHLSTGLLHEALRWVSGGKNFDVEEITCIAMGDTTCTFEVIKQPLD